MKGRLHIVTYFLSKLTITLTETPFIYGISRQYYDRLQRSAIGVCVFENKNF